MDEDDRDPPIIELEIDDAEEDEEEEEEEEDDDEEETFPRGEREETEKLGSELMISC